MSRFINQIFNKKEQNRRVGGINAQFSNLEKTPDMVGTSSVTRYKTATCQSTGRERHNNEDTLFALTGVLGVLDSAVSMGLFLVADGMGGHQSGEVASRLAAQAASQYLMNALLSSDLDENEEFCDVDCQKLVKEAVEEAQNHILRHVPGGGTTLTLVLAIDNDLFSAHVGDSRIYLLGTDGKMKQMTKDHSLVKRLVDLGEISEREAQVHPQRNVLYRALGQNDPFEPDIDQFVLEKGEKILICSDGLWSVLSMDQMQEMIKKTPDLDQLACDLVTAANDYGGPDNISVVLVERLT